MVANNMGAKNIGAKRIGAKRIGSVREGIRRTATTAAAISRVHVLATGGTIAGQAGSLVLLRRDTP